MGNALKLDGIALTVQQGKWKRLASQLSRDVLAPMAAKTDQDGEFPEACMNAIRQTQLLALTVPTEMGGPGENILTTALVIEELARGCASTAMCYTMHMSTIPLLTSLVKDNPAQVDLFVAPLIRGERLHSLAMSEPGSGNRLWHMDSFAQKNGDATYVIDSFKSFATSSGHADCYVVPVRANGEVGPNELSLFIIDGKDPHIRTIGRWDGMGMRGNSSTPVHFDKVIVPELHRLGSETCGFSMLFAYSLPIYQVGLSAVYLGLAQAAYDVAVAHVKKRIHSDTGQSLARLETVQRYIAEMKQRIDQVRYLVYRVAQMSDNAAVLFDELASADLLDEIIRANPDDPFFVDVAQIKVAASEMAIDVTNKAMQVCGGTAYKRGHPAERHYRDGRAGSLMAPSDDTLKLIIGRQVLGIEQPWE